MRQLRGLLAEQAGQLLFAVVGQNMALPIGKAGRMSRGNAGNLKDRVPLASGRRLRRVALLGRKSLPQQRGGVGQRGDHALLPEQRGGHQLQMMRGGGLRQAVLEGLGGKRPRVVLFGLGHILADQGGLNGGQNLAQRLSVRHLALFHLHNVIAELGLHHSEVADLLREDGAVKRRHHGAALGEAQLAALVLAARVVGVLLGQVGKVRAVLKLLEDILRLGLGCGIRLGVGAGGHTDENVARTGLFRHAVVGLVRVVVLLNLLLVRLRHSAGHLSGDESEIGDPALFRRGRGIARGVFLEEGFQIAIRGVDRLAQVIRGENRVFELDLRIRLAKFVPHLLIVHRDPGGNQRLQPVNLDVLLHLLLEGRHRQVELLGNKVGIAVGANELAVGKQELAELALVQKLPHIVVRGLNAQLPGLCQQNLLLEQLLAHLLLEDLHNRRVVGVLRGPLLQLLVSKLAHPLLAHRIARGQQTAVPVGIDDGIVVCGCASHAHQAGDQVHHHAHRSGGDDDDKKCLGQAIVSLQETDHGWT